LFSTFLLWLPFLLHAKHWLGLEIKQSSPLYIFGSFDGPLYVIPAKSLYDINKIDIPGKGLIISLPLSAKYFAAHLPLYPLFIRGFSYLLGYLKSMLFVNILFTIVLAGFFYYLLKLFKITKKPLLLATVFLFVPRFLIVRSIGAPESLFILLILASLLYFEKKQYLEAGIFGGLASMTKSPGVLLFVSYCLAFIEERIRTRQQKIKFEWQKLGIIFVPTGLLLVFLIYYFQYGDFFAYFHSGDNIHIAFPFAVFNASKSWVGTAWLEDVLFVFFIYALMVINLYQSKWRSFFYFALVYFVATTFIQHRDISRYSLPLWPLACITLEQFLTSKKFLIAAIILLPAIYFYGWNFLTYNVMPIGEWQPFL